MHASVQLAREPHLCPTLNFQFSYSGGGDKRLAGGTYIACALVMRAPKALLYKHSSAVLAVHICIYVSASTHVEGFSMSELDITSINPQSGESWTVSSSDNSRHTCTLLLMKLKRAHTNVIYDVMVVKSAYTCFPAIVPTHSFTTQYANTFI